MKRGLILLIAIIATTCMLYSRSGTLTYTRHKPVLIGLDVDYPPLQYVDKLGNAKGADIDMTNELMERLNLPYTYSPQTWGHIKDLILGNKIDLAMMVYSPYRKHLINYSKPILRMYYQILFRKGHAVSFRNLRGLKVAGLTSQQLQDTLAHAGATMYPADDMVQSVRDLSKGKYDAVICFTHQTKYLIGESGVGNVDYDDVGISPREYCYCSHDTALIDAINVQLDKMKADGTIAQIYGADFSYGIHSFTIPDFVYYLFGSLAVIIIGMSVLLHRLRRKYKESDLMLVESGMAIAEALCIYDVHGRMLSLNDAACDLMGITDVKAFIRSKPNIFTCPFFGKYLQEGSTAKVVQTICIPPKPCPGLIAFQNLKAPLYVRFAFKGITSGNSIPFYVLTFSDISELMATQKRLEEEKIRAERNERLKAIFLNNVSHALRTPLNAIVGFSDVIATSENVDENSCHEMIGLIRQNGHQLSYFVDELIKLSTIEGNEVQFFKTALPLKDVFHGIYHESRTMLKSGVELNIHHPDQDFRVEFDQMALEEMVKQLLSNAMKNTVEGSIDVRYDYREAGLYVEVTDTGCGINDQLKSSIFNLLQNKDTYVQSKTPGLGLSICNAMINACQGKIGMESKEGDGSTFWFWIPCPLC
jgi:signal transduction histidine kinase/ABC-type amino acid transport substrate-binding protein